MIVLQDKGRFEYWFLAVRDVGVHESQICSAVQFMKWCELLVDVMDITLKEEWAVEVEEAWRWRTTAF